MMASSADADEAAVYAVEAAYDAAWQAGDIDRLLACLSEDAMLISPRGEMARGHAEIRRELVSVLHGSAQGSKHTSVISRVEFLRTDVAIVDGHAKIEVVGQGGAASILSHRFTDILVRENRGWVIAHIRACPAITTALGNPI